MALNNPENFGKLISEELSNYILDNVKIKDYAEAAEISNMSPSIIEYVVRRYKKLVETNYKGLEAIVKIAIKNAENNMIRENSAIKCMNEALGQ